MDSKTDCKWLVYSTYSNIYPVTFIIPHKTTRNQGKTDNMLNAWTIAFNVGCRITSVQYSCFRQLHMNTFKHALKWFYWYFHFVISVLKPMWLSRCLGLRYVFFQGYLWILTKWVNNLLFLGTTPTSTPEGLWGVSSTLDPYPVETEPSVPRIDWVSRVSSTQQ